MISEAAATGRAVDIVPVEERWFTKRLVRGHRVLQRSPVGPILDALCVRGLWVPPRDLGAIHVAFGEASGLIRKPGELDGVVERIREVVRRKKTVGKAS